MMSAEGEAHYTAGYWSPRCLAYFILLMCVKIWLWFLDEIIPLGCTSVSRLVSTAVASIWGDRGNPTALFFKLLAVIHSKKINHITSLPSAHIHIKQKPVSQDNALPGLWHLPFSILFCNVCCDPLNWFYDPAISCCCGNNASYRTVWPFYFVCTEEGKRLWDSGWRGAWGLLLL